LVPGVKPSATGVAEGAGTADGAAPVPEAAAVAPTGAALAVGVAAPGAALAVGVAAPGAAVVEGAIVQPGAYLTAPQAAVIRASATRKTDRRMILAVMSGIL